MLNDKEIEQLVTANMGFVVNVAMQYARQYSQEEVSLDDLVSEGTLAMLLAARKWDPEKEPQFVRYAVYDIRKAMERFLPEPIKKKDEFTDKLNAGKPLTDDAVLDKETSYALSCAIDELNEREQEVIKSFYGIDNVEKLTMLEIGEKLGYKRERIRQIRKTAERKMRKIMKHSLILIFALLALCSVKAKAENVYIYGISYSPTDSVVYITDVRMLEKVKLNGKAQFLDSRNEYSSQLREYMKSQDHPDFVNCVVFSKEYKKINKDYLKQVQYYYKRNFTMKFLNQMDFQFSAIQMEEEEQKQE